MRRTEIKVGELYVVKEAYGRGPAKVIDEPLVSRRETVFPVEYPMLPEDKKGAYGRLPSRHFIRLWTPSDTDDFKANQERAKLRERMEQRLFDCGYTNFRIYRIGRGMTIQFTEDDAQKVYDILTRNS